MFVFVRTLGVGRGFEETETLLDAAESPARLKPNKPNAANSTININKRHSKAFKQESGTTTSSCSSNSGVSPRPQLSPGFAAVIVAAAAGGFECIDDAKSG